MRIRLLLLALLLAGCVNWDQMLRKRAAFDLQCPEAELQSQELGDVSGGLPVLPLPRLRKEQPL